MKGQPILMSDMTGSLGASTFYHGRNGQIVRLRVTPVQPNTVAQVNARIAFAGAGSSYKVLGGGYKNKWNTFAKNAYNPRKKSNKGQYSGQLAYQGINVGYANSQRLNQPFIFKVNGALLPTGYTTLPYTGAPSDPPRTYSTNRMLNLDASNTSSLTITSALVESDGRCFFELQVDNGLGTNLPFIVNSLGTNVGFAAFLSSGNPTSGMSYKHIEKYLLGYTEPVVPNNVAEISSVGTMSFDLTSPLNLANYQQFPVGGNYCQFSVYMVTDQNQMNLIGRKEITVLS